MQRMVNNDAKNGKGGGLGNTNGTMNMGSTVAGTSNHPSMNNTGYSKFGKTMTSPFRDTV